MVNINYELTHIQQIQYRKMQSYIKWGVIIMNGRERTLAYLKGEAVDHVPFHPLVMQYAAAQTGVKYGEYCTDYRQQSKAMVNFAREYGMDWLHPAGFAYCEASAYGMKVEYPEDRLPYSKSPLIEDAEEDLDKIRPLDIESDRGLMNRVECVRYDKETVGDEFFLAAHCEGPLAEYTDLRGVSDGLVDLIDYPDEVFAAMKIIVDNAKRWIKLQVEAGADVVSVGDAITSQIGLNLYEKLIYPLHKELAEYIKSLGVYSKFHICGNITHLIPYLLKAGVNIIDCDHMVDLKPEFFSTMKADQFFCGNIDPVDQLRFGTPESIRQAVRELMNIPGGKGKIILASGCEVPLGTPTENYEAFRQASMEYETGL